MQHVLEQLPVDAQVRAHILREMLDREKHTATAIEMAREAANFILGPALVISHQVGISIDGSSAKLLLQEDSNHLNDCDAGKDALRAADREGVIDGAEDRPDAKASPASQSLEMALELELLEELPPAPTKLSDADQQGGGMSATTEAISDSPPAKSDDSRSVPLALIHSAPEDEADLSAGERAVLRTAKTTGGTFRAADISKVTGQNSQHVANFLGALTKKGLLKRVELGLYALPDIAGAAVPVIEDKPTAVKTNPFTGAPIIKLIERKGDPCADIIAWMQQTQDVEIEPKDDVYRIDNRFNVNADQLLEIANRHRKKAKLPDFMLEV